jgi:uncharacterized membrane protein YkoI
MIIFVLTVALFIIAMFSIAQTQDKKIKVNNLPKVVITAFQRTSPKATIIGAGTEVENGKTMYEVESIEGKVGRDLLYTDKGEVVEIEESITTEALPDNVKAALEKQFAKYKMMKGEKVTQGTKVEYELEVKSGKKTIAVVLDNNGKIIKSEAVKEKKEKEEKDEK